MGNVTLLLSFGCFESLISLQNFPLLFCVWLFRQESISLSSVFLWINSPLVFMSSYRQSIHLLFLFSHCTFPFQFVFDDLFGVSVVIHPQYVAYPFILLLLTMMSLRCSCCVLLLTSSFMMCSLWLIFSIPLSQLFSAALNSVSIVFAKFPWLTPICQHSYHAYAECSHLKF